MAFHVACPITCKRICFCKLGFPRSVRSSKARNDFLRDVVLVDEFLKDPWGKITVSEDEGRVQVLVPEVPQAPPPPAVVVVVVDGAGGGGGVDGAEETASAVSAQTKRVALQRKAAASMVAAEDYARRFESGYVVTASKDFSGEEQGQSNTNVMCRLCFVGENEGSERVRRMLSCKSCGKKYHRNCLKNWAQNRDLFHWSSWKCPSCRICEICRRTGDPNKFMFCRRCDAAYHCYCQHPPHKNVSSGPYLCPKHTKCHSCESNVPGNGLSLRWFLGYTCCDACGRLFVKGNYCPVCLKVYRDSESTPMVCCDVCQRWVHCQCDDITDEKYLRFQVDGNLQYRCPTCRGEWYQVRDLEDAVRELWRRKDIADKDLIASLRAAAGLPTEDEIFSLSPYSDEEENGPVVLKNEFGRSLKLSLEGVVDKSPKKAKEHGKKWSKKKYPRKKGYHMPLYSITEHDQSFEGHHDVQSHGNSFGGDVQPPEVEGQDISSSVAGLGKQWSKKKYPRKKGYHMPLYSKTEHDQSFEGHHDVQSHGNSFGGDVQPPEVEGQDISSSVAGLGKQWSKKKYPRKKRYHMPLYSKTEHDQSFEGHHDVQSHGNSFGGDVQSPKVEGQDISSSVAGLGKKWSKKKYPRKKRYHMPLYSKTEHDQSFEGHHDVQSHGNSFGGDVQSAKVEGQDISSSVAGLGKKWSKKKYPRKKGYHMPLYSKTEHDQSFEGHHDVQSHGNSFGGDVQPPEVEGQDISSSVAGLGKQWSKKKYPRKKRYHMPLYSKTEHDQSFEGHHDVQSHGNSFGGDVQSPKVEGQDISSSVAGLGKKWSKKKYPRKKGYHMPLYSKTEHDQSFEGHHDVQSHGNSFGGDVQPPEVEGQDISSSVAGLGKQWSKKKYPRKKRYHMPLYSKTEHDQSFEGHHDVQSHGNSFGGDVQSPKVEGQDISSSVAGVANHTEGFCSINQPGVLKHKYVDEVMVSDGDKISRVKFNTSKPHDLDSGENDGKNVSKSETLKAKKLVINLGARKINVNNSPRSDASSCQREQDLMTSNGIEDTSLQRTNSKVVLDRRDGSAKLGHGDRVDHTSQSRGLKIAGRGGNVIKFGRVRPEVSDSNTKVGGGSSSDGHEPEHMHVLSGKRNSNRSRAAPTPVGEIAALRGDRNQLECRPVASGESNDDTLVLQSLIKDSNSKPLLKLKFRKTNLENQDSQACQPEEEKSLIKGQRSKRKRPSPFMEKTSFNEDEDATQSNQRQFNE